METICQRGMGCGWGAGCNETHAQQQMPAALLCFQTRLDMHYRFWLTWLRRVAQLLHTQQSYLSCRLIKLGRIEIQIRLYRDILGQSLQLHLYIFGTLRVCVGGLCVGECKGPDPAR